MAVREVRTVCPCEGIIVVCLFTIINQKDDPVLPSFDGSLTVRFSILHPSSHPYEKRCVLSLPANLLVPGRFLVFALQSSRSKLTRIRLTPAHYCPTIRVHWAFPLVIPLLLCLEDDRFLILILILDPSCLDSARRPGPCHQNTPWGMCLSFTTRTKFRNPLLKALRNKRHEYRVRGLAPHAGQTGHTGRTGHAV